MAGRGEVTDAGTTPRIEDTMIQAPDATRRRATATPMIDMIASIQANVIRQARIVYTQNGLSNVKFVTQECDCLPHLGLIQKTAWV
jgi:hypothetical protein